MNTDILRKIFQLSLVILLSSCPLFSFPGDDASFVQTLNYSYGSRENAMGDVGVTSSRGEAAVYWNPALLGVTDKRLQYGDYSDQFERSKNILASKISHQSFSLCWQPRENILGGFGINVNYSKKTGSNYDWNGDLKETIYGVTWGFGLQDLGIENHTWGVTAKFINSVIGSSFGDDKYSANTFAFDVGYCWKISSMFSFGLCLMNMGRNIYYVDKESQSPLPFKVNLALGLDKETKISEYPVRIIAEYRISRYFVKNNYGFGEEPDPFYRALFSSWKDNSNKCNRKTFLHNFGYEVTIDNHLHLRQGFSIDNRYDEKEMHWGFGYTLLNHFSVDFYDIFSPKTTPYRHGTCGITATVFNLWKWNKENMKF